MFYLLLLTFFFIPTYGIKFSLLGFPTNLLMLWVFVVWGIFVMMLIWKKKLAEFKTYVLSLNRKILIVIALLFLSSIISLFVGGLTKEKLGQFIVLFLQPISLFFISGFVIKDQPLYKTVLINIIYVILAAAGIYAIIQYFTLAGLPVEYQGSLAEPKRALSFFSHPNFYSLFAAPLLAFLLSDLGEKLKKIKKNIYFIAAWVIGAVGLLLSMSRAGWLGLSIAILAFVILVGDKNLKKLFAVSLVALICVAFLTPSLKNRLTSAFNNEKSASSRITLWKSGLTAVKESPIFGLGLMGYGKNYDRLIEDKTLVKHNYPHNIFLNFWNEIGIIGLIGLIWLIGIFVYGGIKNRQDAVKLGVALFLIAMISQGFIDNPYFKNDLAMIFWIILVLGI